MNLKEALNKDKLKEFIAEREGQKGDKAQFDKAISSLVGKSKAARKSSSRDADES